ncbi:uncharacterized protein LOC100575413, partial [Acyrthosiphon pisum]|uniref:Uncharacterized protein n=1 Tax=Acyrthosiphon pisum TaxID=7029 RepID=A0A8R2D870_ACYPI
MNIIVYFRNCLKAVILLWTCIIAFHASVTAFVVQDYNISAIKVNSRGGLLKTIDIFFQRIRNEENQHFFDEIYRTPKATYGPTQHITAYYDKKMFVEKCGDLSEKR